ncbi:MAG: right-handed parallel beta-helix repeat-containing protein [Clostridiales bacterium]|nr:right-handed parallel beta-helix repeat-containing protein [Clostridiales bacterium]
MKKETVKEKRLPAVLLTVLLLAALLTGCGTPQENASSGLSADAAAEETAQAETEEVTIPADPSPDNTALSSGTWTGQIGDKTVTLNGAYIVDGIDAVIEGGTWTSETADQTVFLVVNGGSLTIKDAAVIKTGGGESGSADAGGGGSDDYNFYGLNSAIVCVGEDSTVSIEHCTVDTDAEGANAVFATDNSAVTVSDLEISTLQNSSRGLYATYGGTITAESVRITTQGAHCAPLATDRGGGTVTVTGTDNYLEAHGDGSPCIYSTGSISVEGASGSSEQSQALVIEGKNTVSLKNCSFVSTGNDGIMLYQSMSGDAADKDAAGSVSSLTMEDSTIDYQGDGPLLYVTNTTTEVTVTGCTFKNAGSALISAAAGRWGSDGSNGGALTLTIDGQSVEGEISADSISSVLVQCVNGGSFDGQTSGNVTVK